MTSTLSWPVQNFISRKYSFKPTFFSGLSSPLRVHYKLACKAVM